MLELLGVELPLGIVGLATEFVLRELAQTGRNPYHWPGGVPGCLGSAGPSYFQCWGRCCVLLTSDPMILGALEHLGVDLPLNVVGLSARVRAHSPGVCNL